jgi:hypothetical protein
MGSALHLPATEDGIQYQFSVENACDVPVLFSPLPGIASIGGSG